MTQVKACRTCLETDGELFNLSDEKLVQFFDELTGSISSRDDLPLHICIVCLHIIKKFRIFKQKCYSASHKLQQLELCRQLTIENIKNLNKKSYANNFITTSPEINSYLPMTKVLHTTTFHIDIIAETTTKDELEDIAKNEFLNNYFVTTVEDVVIKKERSDEDIPKNIKIFNINHNELINNDDNDINYFNMDNDTNFEPDDENALVIKEEIEEITNKTKVRKRKIKNTLTLKNKVKREGNKKAHRELKNKRKEEDVESVVEEEVIDDTDQIRKNATLFYNSHPNRQFSEVTMQKRMHMLEKFSKAYNVEVKFLSKEEQEMELEQRKRFYKDLPYTCKLCYRGYSIIDAYNSHMEVHHPSKGDFECHVCKIRCKTNRIREKHVNATHLKRFTCRQCGVVTKSQSYARAHFARHEGASYACDQCGKKFTQQTNYLSHMRSAHSDRARVCPLCYDTFLGPVGLRVHIGVVHRQAVRCNSCGTQFDNETALNKHLATSVNNTCEPGLRSCPVCGLNYETEKQLKKHYDDIHKSEIKCNKCGKTFPTKFRLSTHMQEHRKSETANAGRFICECCGKNFSNLNQLRYHQRLHTGERPYKCSQCAKTFRLQNLLQCHMSVHTDERRYKCPICPKAFRQPAHRTAHMLTHTKERPYACSACPKRYTSASAAREHADTVHRGLPARRRDKHKDN